MADYLSEYYRLPEDWHVRAVYDEAVGRSGFFKFGSEAICYGKCTLGRIAKRPGAGLHDASRDVRTNGSEFWLPFDPSEVIDNLRKEYYVASAPAGRDIFRLAAIRDAYYSVRGLLSVAVRRRLQKIYLGDWQKIPFPHWPVDFTVQTLHENFLRFSLQSQGVRRLPFIWFWPEGANSCLIMTHDVETSSGRDFTPALMDLDSSYGFRASFQVVPEERYEVPEEYVQEIRNRGFEFNIHDLNHDGHLYKEREEFLRRAKRINEYARKYRTLGFRAGAMYRNVDWYYAFEFSYDMSVPNVAHLEPQRGGCCTVMPYFIGKILEIPLTITQDYSLFHILSQESIELWQKQVELIQQRHGLISFITHPDYLIEKSKRNVYEKLLDYLRRLIERDNIWMALPGEVDRWWRARSEMKLVSHNGTWRIEGPGSERARIAYAQVNGDHIDYERDRVA